LDERCIVYEADGVKSADRPITNGSRQLIKIKDNDKEDAEV